MVIEEPTITHCVTEYPDTNLVAQSTEGVPEEVQYYASSGTT